jgi:hypothetical protein
VNEINKGMVRERRRKRRYMMHKERGTEKIRGEQKEGERKQRID